MKINQLAAAVALAAASVSANAAWDYDGQAGASSFAASGELLLVAWETGASPQTFFQDLGQDVTTFGSTPFSTAVDSAFGNFTGPDVRWTVVGFYNNQDFFFPATYSLFGSNADLSTMDGAAAFNKKNDLQLAVNNGASNWAANNAEFTTDPNRDAQDTGVLGGTLGGVDISAAVNEVLAFHNIDGGSNLGSIGGQWTFDGQTISYNPVPVPAAAWLFGSALLGLAGAARRRKA